MSIVSTHIVHSVVIQNETVTQTVELIHQTDRVQGMLDDHNEDPVSYLAICQTNCMTHQF